MGIARWLSHVETVWHAETDPDAAAVLKHWWPHIPNHGDMTAEDFWSVVQQDVDILCGGVPCQPFSSAGRRAGIGDRRHLWPFMRAGVRLLRPPMVVFENVAGLTRGKMLPVFNELLNDLFFHGYVVRWCLLGACAVGAAHHRHRVFVLAVRDDEDLHTTGVSRVDVATCGQKVPAYAATTGTTGPELLPTPSAVSYGSNQGGAAGRVGPVRHSLESLAKLDLLPTPRSVDGERGPVSEARHVNSGRKNGIELASTFNTVADKDGPFGRFQPAIDRHTAVFGTPPPSPTEQGPRGGKRLAAGFTEWLMMLPAGHLTDVLPRRPALVRAGNGVLPLQAATALQLLAEDLLTG